MPILRVRDIDLYYETTGQGQSMLFIHGLGSSTRDWEAQLRFFEHSYQVTAFDLRGHGQSSKPHGPYSMAMFAEDTAVLIRTLDIAPVHVVGLSLGGMIGLQLALDAPDLVRSLTLINTGPEVPVKGFRQRVVVTFKYLQRLFIVRFRGMRRMGQKLSNALFIKPEQEAQRRVFVERWAENDPKAYIAALNTIAGWSVRDRLGSIQCPVLVVTADKDYTPVSFKEAYTAQISQASLTIIPDSRHLTPVEQPTLLNEALMAFLAHHQSD